MEKGEEETVGNQFPAGIGVRGEMCLVSAANLLLLFFTSPVKLVCDKTGK